VPPPSVPSAARRIYLPELRRAGFNDLSNRPLRELTVIKKSGPQGPFTATKLARSQQTHTALRNSPSSPTVDRLISAS